MGNAKPKTDRDALQRNRTSSPPPASGCSRKRSPDGRILRLK